jgi:hypothetical protein
MALEITNSERNVWGKCPSSGMFDEPEVERWDPNNEHRCNVSIGPACAVERVIPMSESGQDGLSIGAPFVHGKSMHRARFRFDVVSLSQDSLFSRPLGRVNGSETFHFFSLRLTLLNGLFRVLQRRECLLTRFDLWNSPIWMSWASHGEHRSEKGPSQKYKKEAVQS